MPANRQPSAVLSRPNPFAALFQEITDIAQQLLRQSSYFELHNVSCDFSGGVLTLQGRVPSYHLKQLAQTSVADVPGVVEIHNHLEVTPPPNSAECRVEGKRNDGFRPGRLANKDGFLIKEVSHVGSISKKWRVRANWRIDRGQSDRSQRRAGQARIQRAVERVDPTKRNSRSLSPPSVVVGTVIGHPRVLRFMNRL